MKEERRHLKEWLTALLPEGMSRNDVAYELGVSRKTISTMLNPDTDGFGNGLTLLRYLRLVGALREVPETAAPSHLEAVRVGVDELLAGMADVLEILGASDGRDANAPGVTR